MDTDTDTLLEFHIRNILEGHATLLTGAGAAYGAKNLFDKASHQAKSLQRNYTKNAVSSILTNLI